MRDSERRRYRIQGEEAASNAWYEGRRTEEDIRANLAREYVSSYDDSEWNKYFGMDDTTADLKAEVVVIEIQAGIELWLSGPRLPFDDSRYMGEFLEYLREAGGDSEQEYKEEDELEFHIS